MKQMKKQKGCIECGREKTVMNRGIDEIKIPNITQKKDETEVVSVIHCIDCRHCSERGGHANCNGYLICTYLNRMVDETDFCSWGEDR